MAKKHYKEKKAEKLAKREQRILERRKKQRIRIIGAILVIICVAVPLTVYAYLNLPENGTEPVNNEEPENNEDIGINIGQTAPDFPLTDTDGNQFSLKDYRGNVVILDFMAIDCTPCKLEMADLNEVYANYSDKSVKIFSIDVNDGDNATRLNEFKHDYNCEWTFAAYGSSVGAAYNVLVEGGTGVPTLYIIDKQGVIAYKGVGTIESDYSVLSSELDKLV